MLHADQYLQQLPHCTDGDEHCSLKVSNETWLHLYYRNSIVQIPTLSLIKKTTNMHSIKKCMKFKESVITLQIK